MVYSYEGPDSKLKVTVFNEEHKAVLERLQNLEFKIHSDSMVIRWRHAWLGRERSAAILKLHLKPLSYFLTLCEVQNDHHTTLISQLSI